MQTAYFRRTGFLRATEVAAVFYSFTASAQEVADRSAWVEETFSSFSNALIAVCGALFLLLILSLVFIRHYRKKFLTFYEKCGVLGPALEKTDRELRQMTEQFHDESELHERLIDDAGAAVFQLNTDGECIYVNSAMETLCGFSKSRILREGLLNVIHPEDREAVRDEWEHFAERDGNGESSYRLLREDGRIVHVISRGSVFREKNRQVIGYFGLLMDVDHLERRYDEVHRAAQRSRRFIQQTVSGFYELRLDEPVLLTLSPDQVAAQIFQRAKLTECGEAVAGLYGKTVSDLIGTPLSELPGGCGILQDQQSIQRFVTDGFRAAGAETVVDNYRGTPVCLQNDAVGMVEDGKLVSIWGGVRDVSRRKREAEKQQQRITFFRRILDALPGDVFVKDPRCRYLYVSRGVEERTGIPAEDWKEKTVFEVLPAAPRDFNRTSIEVMKSGLPQQTVSSRSGPNGSAWIETLESPLISEDGVIEGAVGISVDVTKRMHREETLRRSEARFRQLVEQNPSGIVLADAESKTLTYANPAFCDLFGYTAEELSGLSIGDLHSPGSRKEVLAEWDNRAQHAQPFEDLLPCQRKDRSIVYMEVGVARGQLDETDLVIGIYSDASNRRQAEADLERQRDIQAGLLRNAAVLVAEVDGFGTICSVNDTLLELIGSDETALVGKPYVDTLVCKEDRHLLDQAFDSRQPNIQNDYEYRLRAVNGTLYTVTGRVRSWTDSAGKVDRFTVSGIDITQQQKREASLRSECEDLRWKASELEENLAARQEELKEESQQRQLAEEQLQKIRDEFAAERETLRTESGQKIEALEKDLQQIQQRESKLAAECAQLSSRLSQTEEALQARTQELNVQRAEREAEEKAFEETRQKLEARVEQQAAELAQAAKQCKQLEEQLESSSKEAAAGKETLHVQVDRQTAPLKKEINELRAREKRLQGEHDKAVQKLSELEQVLEKRSKEIHAEASARKKETEAFRQDREQLTALIEEEKEKLARQVETAKGELAESRKSEKAWAQERKALEGSVQNLEKALEERTKELEQAEQDRVRLERELEENRQELAAGRESVQAQIQKKTARMEAELKDMFDREAGLKSALSETERKLGKLEKELEASRQELEDAVAAHQAEAQEFQDEKFQLEEAVVQEKNRRVEEVRQFNDIKAKSRNAEIALRRKETALQKKVEQLEAQLEQRIKEFSEAADRQIELERELEASREETLKERETADRRIEEKTEELQQQLAAQLKREQEMAAERDALNAKLTEVRKQLKHRNDRIEALQTTRTELEEAVEREKENLAHRVQLFKDEAEEFRKDEAGWKAAEEELLNKIRHVEAVLEQRVKDLARETEERRRTELELEQLNRALEADHQMIYDLSEDLSAPLGPVLELSSAVMQEETLPETAHDKVSEINHCGQRVQAVLNYHVERIHLENGVIRFRPGPFELGAFLKELTGEFTEKAEEKRLFFAFSRAGDFPGKIRSDRQRIRQILEGLFDHALGCTATGQLGLHSICEELESGEKRLVFQLMYSGLECDAAVMGGLFENAKEKPCREMSEDEFQIDLMRRHAQQLGGGLYLESRSHKHLLSLVLPVEQEAGDTITEAEHSGESEEPMHARAG